ncbi:sushi, von Willebrand factor type A, EGF and pentraxin domain-containing protein 1-like [Rhopilema esculentum]|uniref:sushi, von Willebrand factor type A, EGF and pentraxin domain-containing protein 1-like n=1 Tax=Rhopilema esculentum TaxID=499914 RepID=UPI0031E1A191
MFSLCIAILVLSFLGSSDGKTYQLKVRTSKHIGAGTGENVKITLFGSNGKKVFKEYNGWGLHMFDFGMTNELELEGEDIGSIIDIQAQIVKTGRYLDKWRLFWIKVFADGDAFKGTFEYTFRSDKETSNAKLFEILGCREGYEPTEIGGRKTCADRNECLVTCKGPGQECVNIPGSYRCNCKPGFYFDGSECRDYDECLQHDQDPCSYPNAHCKNLPGSYECRCNRGYEGDYHSCQDKDECKLNLHSCSQKCVNIVGGYRCDCNTGFKLAVDGKTCLDADECKGAHSCNLTTSVCYDEYGSHRCICKAGYKEDTTDPKRKTCIPIECQPLSNMEKSIILSPPRCMNGKNIYGDECSVKCAPGYELDAGSAKTLRCTSFGFVNINGNMPMCKPKPCGKLAVPNFGFTVPPSCSSVGATQGSQCYIFCDHGFVLAGERAYTCDQQKYDKDPSKTICVRIPKIECPSDVTVALPQDSSRVALDNNFPYFRTNVRRDQISSNIAGIGPSYEFPLGHNVVVYKATNEVNQTDKCSFVVSVEDRSPPVLEFCPSSFTVVSKGAVPVNVTWEEPRFKDNVGVQSVIASSKSGELRSPTDFTVLYRAFDASRNMATCKFTVSFKVLRCDFDSIPGGDQLIQKSCMNMGTSHLCMAQCVPTKTFNVINSKHMFLKFMWSCVKADFEVDQMPDCVDFQPKNGKPCPAGSTDVNDYRSGLPVCAKCARGTYYVNGSCTDCPTSMYQPLEGSLSCEKCKSGYGTSTKRNKLSTDCKEQCPLGYFSTDGLSDGQSSCEMCPKNTYADKFGSKSCLRCPNGTTTDGSGRTSISACRYAPKNIRMVPGGTIEVSAGEKVHFDCFADGNPMPFVHIRKQQSQANPMTHSLQPVAAPNSNTKGIRYMISSASIHDSDYYVCRAENNKGIIYNKIQLVVTEGSGMSSIG